MLKTTMKGQISRTTSERSKAIEQKEILEGQISVQEKKAKQAQNRSDVK